MTKFLSVLLIFIFCLNTISQTKDEALRDAKKTSKATLDSDFRTVLKYTFPPILKLMGGKENALEIISKSMSSMKDTGFDFKSADVISVSEIVKEQNQHRCLIKNNYVMTFNGQKITSEAYLLGIYNQKENIWTFIEAKQLANPAINQVLPDFKTSLHIPEGKVSTEKI
jgi:hypothetical protein